jgi:hypothetical protein
MIHNVSRRCTVMELQAAFDALSSVIDGYESRGLSVETVDATTDGDGVRASVDVGVAPSVLLADGAPAPEAARATDTGALRVDLPTDDLLSPPASRDATVAAEVDAARATEDGLVVTVTLAVDPTATRADASDDHTASGDDAPDARDPASVRDESVPPFEDVDYLAHLYERCDTFTEMTRLFEMDVSAETVRRYTIEAGVHDPDSYDTAADDADSRTEHLPVEDVDVPADLTVGAVSEAVVECRTIHEVHRRLGLDQERTRELLRRLDLIDLVTHRIDAVPDRGTSPEEVAARIRSRAAGDA